MEIESNNNLFSKENNDIILPDSTDLDWAQILYALNYRRLIFISDYQTWLNFHNNNLENGYKYNDYSPEDLCYRFMQRILPNIYEYELNEQELHLLNLLDLHPDFRRTERGFIKMKPIAELSFPPSEGVIETIMQEDERLRELQLITESVSSNNQIVISNFGEMSSIQHKFNFNEENAALLSVVLSSDDDLPNCELLTVEEIHNRFKAAKYRFEMSGQQLENVDISADDLLKKLKTLNKLKEAVTELVNKSLCKY